MLIAENDKKTQLLFSIIRLLLIIDLLCQTLKSLFFMVTYRNKLGTNITFFVKGIEIQDDCQPWPLIAGTKLFHVTNYFETTSTAVNIQKQTFITLVRIFMTMYVRIFLSRTYFA